MNTLIAIITFCLGVGLKSFTSYLKDRRIEKGKEEIAKKQFFSKNFFPIYRDIYSAMHDIFIQVESFINKETTFTHSNIYVKDTIEITEEDYKKYMFGDDEEQVYIVNFIFHLQLLQDNIAELRELHQKNAIMFTDDENELIESYYNISNVLMWSLYKISQTGQEESFSEYLIEQSSYLEIGKEKVRDKFRERFVLE
ncbi:hypothetical protein [Staphylococcus simulans]|uniref:hypothetical protein n=1 Tax=Staphylococcus simulans TaxID=1286 RepID=UPI00076B4561|nr:hypothetical protein [Staphylococcus simulans]AMG96654.1 hypothetical protein AL483_07380 [Staphylococcus simulans]DAL42875.1 MAG TPA_asm: hypothetical protein [Bacteriophage sp.]